MVSPYVLDPFQEPYGRELAHPWSSFNVQPLDALGRALELLFLPRLEDGEEHSRKHSRCDVRQVLSVLDNMLVIRPFIGGAGGDQELGYLIGFEHRKPVPVMPNVRAKLPAEAGTVSPD